MAISTDDISRLLSEALPGAEVEVLGGEGKYQVNVQSATFAGLNRVKRQQVVYRILGEHISSGAIHAVSMLLQTPEEAGGQAPA